MSVPRRLRAPQQNGAVLAEPPLEEVGRLLSANRQLLDQGTTAILGRPFVRIRHAARQAAVTAARAYLAQGGEPVPDLGDQSLMLAGHQPELFHPGVWVKNFALQGLARLHNSTPINLVVDNDTAKSAALALPGLTPAPHVAHVPFDHWAGDVPYEERQVRDETMFAELPERAAPFMQDWSYKPLLNSFWVEVRRQAKRTPLLGERLAAARRALERSWGCHNLELPVSRLCQTEPFAWFACHLLSDLPRFHAIYNTSVHDYRRLYGIRSRNHPVPDLATDGDWLEVPFWAWHADQQQRGRLFARSTSAELQLRVNGEPWPALPLNQAEMARAWQDLERHGMKIRSRALTNTLFARLFLCDLFIHGIGGGKYDELTDEIIRRFYEWKPPAYFVLSATLLLPFATVHVGSKECRKLAREARDLYYNPQRHLSGDGQADATLGELVGRKQSWIARQPATVAERRQRFEALRAVNEELRPGVVSQETAIIRELRRCQDELKEHEVLERRDYAFCLYPEAVLRAFCIQFLA